MSHVIAAGDDIIRTPDQRLRVFVSSTLGELAEERAVVKAAIERLHLIPVMFELGARPHAPRNLYRAYLEQSHVFVGIYWERYGWVAPGEDVSGLEDEYRLSDGMPQLLYIKESSNREPRLEELLARVRGDDRASYRHFRTPEELAALVQDDLAVLLTERFERAGAVGGDAATGQPTPASPPPVPLTRTIGRDAEIAEVVDLVARQRVRLVTLTGPGGIGKSRLALEIAARVRDAFPEGVHLIPLEPLADPASVLRAIADRLGVVGEGLRSLEELLATQLQHRRLLLLDNFEHVIDAAPKVAFLLDLCPELQILVTSRRPLRLRGEHEYPLQPLEVPDEQTVDVAATAGVELFVQRARGVRPDFELTDDNTAAVAELVRRLDGLPLAIELAAARTRLFSPAALLTRFDERLDVLSSGAVDLPERQRTLRATIDWSYRLLLPDEQRLLDRLSVFAGGASLEAIEAVCGEPGSDVLETVSSLLEKSLLLLLTAEDEPRVQLLNTVRVYAAERLAARGEDAMIADRHADWFLQRAALVDPIGDPTAHDRFDVMLRESDDIRAAMDWVLASGDPQRAAAFGSTTWMWFWLRGRLVDVAPWFEQALVLADHPDASLQDRAFLQYCHGQILEILGDSETAVVVLAEALAAFEELGHQIGIAATQLGMSAALPNLGRPDEAYERALASLRIGEELGEPHLIGFSSAIVGTSRFVVGDYDAARVAHQRTLDAARAAHVETLEAQALVQMALVDIAEGLLDAAWGRFAEAATALTRTRNSEVLAYWLEFAAAALEGEGQFDVALRAMSSAGSIRDELHVVVWPLMRPHRAASVARLRDRLGERADDVAGEGRRSEPWALMGEILAAHAG